MPARFDNGFDSVVTAIIDAIKKRVAKLMEEAEGISESNEAIKQKDAEIGNLKQQIDLMSKLSIADKFPNCKVTIKGHTDAQGSDDANQTLSERQAKAVAEYFLTFGLLNERN